MKNTNSHEFHKNIFLDLIKLMIKRDLNYCSFSITDVENSMLSGLFLTFANEEELKYFTKGRKKIFSVEENNYYKLFEELALKDKASIIDKEKNLIYYDLRIVDFTDTVLAKLRNNDFNLGCFDDLTELIYEKLSVGTKRELSLALAMELERPVFVMSQTAVGDLGLGTLYWLDSQGVKYQVNFEKNENNFFIVINHFKLNNCLLELVSQIKLNVNELRTNLPKLLVDFFS
jgi:hypothetical protein